MNRVCLVTNEGGDILKVASDEPIRFFVVNDHIPNELVYELRPDGGGVLRIGVEQVRSTLRDDPVGHMHDQDRLGTGHGPRRPPTPPSLRLVD